MDPQQRKLIELCLRNYVAAASRPVSGLGSGSGSGAGGSPLEAAVGKAPWVPFNSINRGCNVVDDTKGWGIISLKERGSYTWWMIPRHPLGYYPTTWSFGMNDRKVVHTYIGEMTKMTK